MTRILVAEDEADMAMGLRDNLQFEGYEVIVAGDGEAALQAATGQSPDLILLDLMMPKMDGLDVCRRVREAGIGVICSISDARISTQLLRLTAAAINRRSMIFGI